MPSRTRTLAGSAADNRSRDRDGEGLDYSSPSPPRKPPKCSAKRREPRKEGDGRWDYRSTWRCALDHPDHEGPHRTEKTEGTHGGRMFTDEDIAKSAAVEAKWRRLGRPRPPYHVEGYRAFEAWVLTLVEEGGSLVKAIVTPDELKEVVDVYSGFSEFAFDVETRGGRQVRMLQAGRRVLSRYGEGTTPCLACGLPIPSRRRAYCSDLCRKAADKDKPALDTRTNEVWCISLAGPGVSHVIPMGHPDKRQQLYHTDVFKALKPLFFSGRRKINQNVGFDLLSIAKYYGGEIPPPPYGDVMTMIFLINENLRAYNLGALAEHYIGFKYSEKLGEEAYSVGWRRAMRYSITDAKMAWMLWWKLHHILEEKAKLGELFDLEMNVLQVLLAMRQQGAYVDINGFRTLRPKLESQLEEIEERIRSMVGHEINLNSTQQLGKWLYDELKLPCTFYTETGQRSTAANALKTLARRHEAPRRVLEYKEVNKLLSTYVVGFIPTIDDDSRIRASFNQAVARTGRLSCVSGNTELFTSRGSFRFKDYLPLEGDLVQTHTGAWKPVIRKIYRGLDRTYRVELNSGAALVATADHRILTPQGWTAIGDLAPGSTVYHYVGLQEIRGRLPQREPSAGDLLWAGSTNTDRSGRPSRYDLAQRPVHREHPPVARETESRTGSPVLTVEDRQQEPYDGQEWFPAPQLPGRGLRWARLSPAEGEREVHPGSPESGSEAATDEGVTGQLDRSPHRRGQNQQRPGQSSRDDGGGTLPTSRPVTWLETTVKKVDFVGTAGVWDIEVAENHSYLVQGFISHNCSQPNLQNIPARYKETVEATLIRQLFTAPRGRVLVVADYSQIELRVLAHQTKDRLLVYAYTHGLDLHTQTASLIYKVPQDEVTVEQRAIAKNSNFNFAFEGGPGRVVEMSGISMREAEKVYDAWHRAYPGVKKWGSEIKRFCLHHGYVETLYGRKRRLKDISSSDIGLQRYAERQAVNHPIQGCLPADTRVLTPDGWLPLGDFTEGVVWTGESWAMAKKIYRGPAPRVRLHLSDGRTFDCDNRHKLLINDEVWPRWVNVMGAKGLPLVRDTHTEWGHPKRDVEDWYWAGRMIGDGSVGAVTWKLTFGPYETEDADRFCRYLALLPIKGATNSKTGFGRGSNGRCTDVSGSTKAGREHWASLGIIRATARTKRIPAVVFTLDRERRQAFLDGYAAADGHTRPWNEAKKITSVNRELLGDALRLMQTLGETGSISQPMRNGNGYIWYDLHRHLSPHTLTIEEIEQFDEEPMYTLVVDDYRHAYSSEGLISKNTAADIAKLAIVRVHAALREFHAALVLQIHDEFVIECDEAEVVDAIPFIKEAMEGIQLRGRPVLDVPLEVNIGVGTNWSEAK